MICVFSEWVKKYLDKQGIKTIKEVKSRDNVIYFYEETEHIKKLIKYYTYQ